jgi:hypothetical protein
MAEALVSYQIKLLGAMEGVNDKVEHHGTNILNGIEDGDFEEDTTPGVTHQAYKSATGIKEVDGMISKVDKLEHGEKRLQAELTAIKDELEAMSNKLKRNAVSRSLFLLFLHDDKLRLGGQQAGLDGRFQSRSYSQGLAVCEAGPAGWFGDTA